MAVSENVKRGSVEVIILSILRDGDMYGYQLSQEIADRSGGRYLLQECSMYPMLYRMVDKGLISDRQEKVGRRRIRVYYHLEPKGEEYLRQARAEYLKLTYGVLGILGIERMEDMIDE